MIAAAPGAGKTRPALVLAKELLRRGEIDRVAIVCPTAPLTQQWAAAAGALGLSLQPDSAHLLTTRDFQGVAVTYARVAAAASTYARECTSRTLVIADEVHHLGDELAWGDGFKRAFGKAGRTLLLSGTPFRSDDAPIPGITYDRDGFSQPDIAYSYAEAIRDGACRRMIFVPFDGTLVWQSGDQTIESSFDEELTVRERGRRYRTAISTELPEGLPRILRQADQQLTKVRADGHATAGGLVVAADSAHARVVAATLQGDLRRGADRRPPPGLRGPRATAALRRRPDALDRRGQHGFRGRGHPTPARRRLRDHGEDGDDLPPDRRALRPDRGRGG